MFLLWDQVQHLKCMVYIGLANWWPCQLGRTSRGRTRQTPVYFQAAQCHLFARFPWLHFAYHWVWTALGKEDWHEYQQLFERMSFIEPRRRHWFTTSVVHPVPHWSRWKMGSQQRRSVGALPCCWKRNPSNRPNVDYSPTMESICNVYCPAWPFFPFCW